MSNHFYHALNSWLPLKDQAGWVLGTVIQTKGSVYRKTGAMMLLSDASHQLGILSGGCLEADLLLQARKVLSLGKSRRVVYDAEDEGGLAWRLGIGCGGAAEILLMPCSSDNQFLSLPELHKKLAAQQACEYSLALDGSGATLKECERIFNTHSLACELDNTSTSFKVKINPVPHLLIMGGGIDTRSVSDIAENLGWRVSVCDDRPANARRENFLSAHALFACPANELSSELLNTIDAAIVATHSMKMDAEAIVALQRSSLRYMGLLGPHKRRSEVLALANLTEKELRIPLAGPLGLGLGGDLPESIALSALAECHAVLFEREAKPMSNAYL